MLEFTIRRVALLSATLGVSILTPAAARAAVVTNYFDRDLTNSASTTAPDSKTTLVDFDADGTDDFSFTHTTAPFQYDSPFGTKVDYNGKLTLDAASTSLFLSVVKDNDPLAPPSNYAENLSVGSIVYADQPFISISQTSGSGYDNRLYDSTGDGNVGAFGENENDNTSIANGNAYVGFAFGDPAMPNYGYLEFTNLSGFLSIFTGFSGTNSATLVGAAYESTPGVGIAVVPLNVPEPASLVLVGVAGLTLLRRRRA